MTDDRGANSRSKPALLAPARGVDASHSAASQVQVAGQRFRPDIEGLRAVAIIFGMLFHGYGRHVTAGFVGVDVFFVLSGFLITNLLLQEKVRTGRISIARFYARRVRRILPLSTLVVIVVVVASYLYLGFITGNNIATDAKWTAVFAVNIHFGQTATDYFGSALPPSPLQHMWSLSVEEQFYVVWPALLILLAVVFRGARHRKALAVTLVIVIALSFTWSVIDTVSDTLWAYFSPLTRAWELALGALLAVLAPTISRLRPAWPAQLLALCGLLAIGLSAIVISPSMPYPGYAVALPVIGTAFVIAAGCARVDTFVGRVLSVRPMQWIGIRSYSLYLWHWPMLVITAQYVGGDLNNWQVTVVLLLSIVVSALTYRLFENPIRRARFWESRTGMTLAVGAGLILGTIFIAQFFIANHYGTWNPFQAV